MKATSEHSDIGHVVRQLRESREEAAYLREEAKQARTRTQHLRTILRLRREEIAARWNRQAGGETEGQA